MNYQKVYMNQIYSSTLLGQLAHMWKNQLLCDAMIRTGQVTTKAHRVVLVAACPMLQSMENASSGSHLEVRLAADIKQDAVNTFLQYLYEGYMMLTEENCRDVEKVARLLQVDNVSKCCSDFYKCMQSKTGQNLGGSQYKYSGQDATDFKHVKATELQKTVHERMMKRTSEFNRPGSPGGKRPRFNRGGSPDVTVIGAEQADDTASMAHSYRSSAPDPWERVPHLGSGLSSKGASGKQQPGVVDIVEESLELVQTEPLDKDSHQTGSRPSDSRNPQKSSMSISVASHFNTDPEVNVVNVTGNKNQGSSSDLNTSTSAPTPSSRGSITVSPLTIFSDSPATSREVAGMTSSSSSSTSLRQEPQRQSEPVMYIQRASEHVTSTPQRQSFPTGSQSKPFAVGSAVQAGSSPASSETPPIGSPAANKSRGPSRQDASGQDDKGKDQRPKSADSQDMIPDLSIVKVESNILEDTGGLDMHVDMPEAGVMHMHTTRMSQGGEHEDASDNEMEDWTREEMSNEGSNVSGDQNNSWYMGTFKDLVTSHRTRSAGCIRNDDDAVTIVKTTSFKDSPRTRNKSPQGGSSTGAIISRKSGTKARRKSCPSRYLGASPIHSGPSDVDTLAETFSVSAQLPIEGMSQNEALTGHDQFRELASVEFEKHKRKGRPCRINPDYFSHRAVRTLDGKSKPCAYCHVNKIRTKSGWYVYTSYRCDICDVPLCTGTRDCFNLYHACQIEPDIAGDVVQNLSAYQEQDVQMDISCPQIPVESGEDLALIHSNHSTRPSSVEPVPHTPVHNADGKNKPCAFCHMNKIRTKSGWYVYTTYRCGACDVPLCTGSRDCFNLYHNCQNVVMDTADEFSEEKSSNLTSDTDQGNLESPRGLVQPASDTASSPSGLNISNPDLIHRPVKTTDTKNKPCAYCNMKKVKTKSGWYVYTTYKCEACGVALCTGARDCFNQYHAQLETGGEDCIILAS